MSLESVEAAIDQRMAAVAASAAVVPAPDPARLAAKQTKKLFKKILGDAPIAADKLAKLEAEFSKQAVAILKLEKEASVSTKHHEKLTHDHASLQLQARKFEATNTTLKELCTKLQQRSALLEEENKRVHEREIASRTETMQRVDDSLRDIQAKITASDQEREKVAHENATLLLGVKRAEAVAQLSQKQIEAKEAEINLLRAQKAELERSLQISSLQQSELSKYADGLKQQLAMYSEKFQSLESTLSSSHQAMLSFKADIGKSSEAIKRLHKEKAALEDRVRKAEARAADFAKERDAVRDKLQAEVAAVAHKMETLSNLCRRLKSDNDELRRGVASSVQSESAEDSATVAATDAAPTPAQIESV